MTETLFFRALADEDKEGALEEAVAALRDGAAEARVFATEPESFRQVPGTPFAYWISDAIRGKFRELPRFESEGRSVRVGLQTSDDFRFVRTWWEVDHARLIDAMSGPWKDLRALQDWCNLRSFQGRKWAPFAKGGEYSPHYADLHLVTDWEFEGKAVKEFVETVPWTTHWSASVRSVSHYFLPGVTYADRTSEPFGPRPLPCGAIISVKGSAAFWDELGPGFENRLLGMTALMGSRVFLFYLDTMVGTSSIAKSYQTGTIGRVPVPRGFIAEPALPKAARQAHDAKRSQQTVVETSHCFLYPCLIAGVNGGLADRLTGWLDRHMESERLIADAEADIQQAVLALYQFSHDERATFFNPARGGIYVSGTRSASGEGDAEDDDSESSDLALASLTPRHHVDALVAYTLGCAFGRWDIRLALDPSLAPTLADPFAPLPVCPPGMLVGPDGLPAKPDGVASEEWLRARPDAITLPPEGSVAEPTITDEDYPLALDWDGILADDPDREDDLVARVRQVLALLFGERAEAFEQEACELLQAPDLRSYFRRHFFDAHVKRYSKSRRKAPIYWYLRSARGSYGLWIYYQRLDSDTYSKALVNYVEPKLRREENRLAELRQRSVGLTGASARRAEREIEDLEKLLAEIEAFRTRLQRAVELGLRPDLDDGVILNLAPLWELVPWREPKKYWDELLAGKYAWSSISQQLRAKGLVK